MNFSFLEWEKTKLETTLLYPWIRVVFSWGVDFSRNTEPESCLIGFILETVTMENKDLRLGTRIFVLLYGKNFNDFVQLVMKLKHFVRGSFPGWGKHLTCICNRCQSVVSRLKLGRAYCLNGNEEATRTFLKGSRVQQVKFTRSLFDVLACKLKNLSDFTLDKNLSCFEAWEQWLSRLIFGRI